MGLFHFKYSTTTTIQKKGGIGFLAKFGQIRADVTLRLPYAVKFSLIIAVFAVEARFISAMASQLIQLTTIVTMIVSCYWVVFGYPTPLGVSKALKQD